MLWLNNITFLWAKWNTMSRRKAIIISKYAVSYNQISESGIGGGEWQQIGRKSGKATLAKIWK